MDSEISKRLESVDATLVRSEFKLWIFKHYFMPSIRFLLTVHDVTHTDLNKLDRKIHKYLKKWAGLPQCATNSIFHLRNGLDIPFITSLLREAHFFTHVDMRLKGDNVVNLTLDNRIQRESSQIRKKSITVESEQIFQTALSLNTFQG